jgi:UDP-N-acetylglucosamine 4,6-dehydratase
MLSGNVLLTGGSGYIGRAIMRRATRENWPCSFTVYSRDELKQAQCKRKYKDARYLLGDVRDTERLSLAMGRHDTVIHTAALKYVPEGEHNVSECISVNVGGTQSVLSAARAAQVGRVVVISTDKAVAPTNVYGMSKALCERLVGETGTYEYAEGPTITAVRYGNVIGSTGSVVPEFKHQYEKTGVVTVTNPDMTRFWMTADDAIDLILLAARSEAGDVVIGHPPSMELGDLVQVIVPGTRYNIIGLRPGEKMHETIMTSSECLFSSYYVREGAYCLPPISRRHQRNDHGYDMTSEMAERMTPEEFAAAVEDSQTI